MSERKFRSFQPFYTTAREDDADLAGIQPVKVSVDADGDLCLSFDGGRAELFFSPDQWAELVIKVGFVK